MIRERFTSGPRANPEGFARALEKNPLRVSALVLLAAVLLSHAPLLTAGYVQDDHLAVESSAVAASGSVSAILGASYWEGARGADRSLYRPVTVATYAIERALAGRAAPAVSHAVNLLLHAASCWLLFALATGAGIEAPAALAAALLFAVCPSKSEAVANVVGRAEILAALFTLAAVRLALVRGSRAAAWGAGACVLLACGSKETGLAALPLVALAAVAAAWPERRDRTAALDAAGMILPSALAFTTFVILRTRALEAFFPAQTVPAMDNPLVAEHGARYVATALALALRYARIVLVPVGLANDYAGASVPIEATLLAWRPLAGAALLASLAGSALLGRRIALFAAMALLPYLLVGQLLVPVGAILAERFLYLPVAGLCLLGSAAIARFGAPARRAALAAAVVLAALMVGRALDWESDATIFAATARNNPASPRAPYWLGTLAAEAGRLDEARAGFDAAIRNWPAFAAPWHDKGLLLARGGDGAGAERALREAARLEPAWAAPRLNLALLLHRRGDLEGAAREARRATLLDPDSAKAWAELGHARFELRRFREAADAYRRAVSLGRTDLVPRLAESERR